MSPIILLTILSTALTGSNPCPVEDRIRFFESPDGFEGFRLLGDDSYRSLFVGAHLEPGRGAGGSSGSAPTFSLDDLKLAWELVPASAFTKAKSGTPRQRLDAFYAFQTKLLRDLGRQHKIELAGIQAYDPHDEARPDGKPLSFRIWKAILGKKGRQHAQYFVATGQDAGIVLLSVVVSRPADEPKTMNVIDSYMAGFAPVDAPTCAKLQGATAAAPPKR